MKSSSSDNVHPDFYFTEPDAPTKPSQNQHPFVRPCNSLDSLHLSFSPINLLGETMPTEPPPTSICPHCGYAFYKEHSSLNHTGCPECHRDTINYHDYPRATAALKETILRLQRESSEKDHTLAQLKEKVKSGADFAARSERVQVAKEANETILGLVIVLTIAWIAFIGWIGGHRQLGYNAIANSDHPGVKSFTVEFLRMYACVLFPFILYRQCKIRGGELIESPRITWLELFGVTVGISLFLAIALPCPGE